MGIRSGSEDLALREGGRRRGSTDKAFGSGGRGGEPMDRSFAGTRGQEFLQGWGGGKSAGEKIRKKHGCDCNGSGNRRGDESGEKGGTGAGGGCAGASFSCGGC